MPKRRYELSISPTYVSTWGIWEGLRELAQNTIDQNNIDPDKHKYSIHYDLADQTLIFKNLNSKLDIKSLLLGSTTKDGNKNQIGQFGEGFKLAFLVLLREGLYLQINNANEFWEPKIINSKRYNSRLLVVDVSPGKKDNKDLVFKVYGVKPQMYAEFANNFLTLDYPKNCSKTHIGNILLDEKYRRKLFVSGIYVGEVLVENCKYGYDLSPVYIELDRDRKKVDSFNLFWTTSQLFSVLEKDDAEILHSAIKNDIPEIEYIYQFHRHGSMFEDICSLNHGDFLNKYGVKAVPVKDQEEADIIKKKYNSLVPIIVNKVKHHYITNSPNFKSSAVGAILKRQEKTPYQVIEEFIKKNKRYIYGAHKKLIEDEILRAAVNWKVR